MNPELSLYENLKVLIAIEQESGTSSLFSGFALELLRTLDEQKETTEKAIEGCKYSYHFNRYDYDAASSEALRMWDLYSDAWESIVG